MLMVSLVHGNREANIFADEFPIVGSNKLSFLATLSAADDCIPACIFAQIACLLVGLVFKWLVQGMIIVQDYERLHILMASMP